MPGSPAHACLLLTIVLSATAQLSLLIPILHAHFSPTSKSVGFSVPIFFHISESVGK